MPDELKFHAETGWKSWVPAIDEIEWYPDLTVISVKRPAVTEDGLAADELEAARRFVQHWLWNDSHGFVIPGDEWGKSLLNWLRVLMSHTSDVDYEVSEDENRD